MDQYGWVGKILRVNLTSGEISTVPTSNYLPTFVGGRGIATKIYWDEVPPDCKAFDPANKLIFVTGPATGTAAPTNGKYTVATKSPAMWPVESFYYSNPGGHWGPELKFAGFDGLIVEGKASEPVYLWIHDGQAEIKGGYWTGRNLWGLMTNDCFQELRKVHGEKTRIIATGPAGENLIREAVITDGVHATGCGGFGAVMGSKNLKAIAVRGTASVNVANPQGLMDLYRYFGRLASRTPAEAAQDPIKNVQNPVRTMQYYTKTPKEVPFVDDSWLGDAVKDGIAAKRYGGCFACPVCCEVHVDLKDRVSPHFEAQCYLGPYVETAEYYKPQKPVGPQFMLATATQENLGLSQTHQGYWQAGQNHVVLLFRAGALTEEDMGVSVDKIGSIEYYESIYHKIVNREGTFGKLLAEGEYRFFIGLMDKWKSDPAMVAKIKSIYDMRTGKSGIGWHWGGISCSGSPGNPMGVLAVATGQRTHANDTFGHLNGTDKALYEYGPGGLKAAEMEEIKKAAREKYLKFLKSEKGWSLPGEPVTLEGAVPTTVSFLNADVVGDSVTYCRWAFPKFYSWYTPDHLGDAEIGSKVLSAVTGINKTEEELWGSLGEVVNTLQRAIVAREGRRREHDWFTDSYFTKQKWCTKESLSQALDAYYAARGWDKNTGVPTRTQLEKLGMKDVADDLGAKYGVQVPA
jgi:aldehyde:ferredoxin oxidoreductase